LSLAFEKKLAFGIVRSEESDLMNEYGVKTTPTIMVIKSSEKKPFIYNGELKYQNLFDYLNIYSEAFVPGGDNVDQSKPWM